MQPSNTAKENKKEKTNLWKQLIISETIKAKQNSSTLWQ